MENLLDMDDLQERQETFTHIPSKNKPSTISPIPTN